MWPWPEEQQTDRAAAMAPPSASTQPPPPPITVSIEPPAGKNASQTSCPKSINSEFFLGRGAGVGRSAFFVASAQFDVTFFVSAIQSVNFTDRRFDRFKLGIVGLSLVQKKYLCC